MPEPERTPRARHRKPEKRDGVLLGLKFGAFVVALGIVVGVVSVLSDSPRPQPAGADPRRPATTTTTTTVDQGSPPAEPSVVQAAPPVASAVLAGPPASVVPTTTTTTGRPTKTKKPAPGTVTVGEQCDTPGELAFVGFRAVVCRSAGPGEPPRWHLVY
ncbi:hypothetical protein [Actinokineospora xionganensis]|uniref:Uncharacterized protein n=1 Tax=Actinokineospora xionganensis TaxID=2684470 RepID=A0ABR7L5D1_9PSEU|nr:hypothetical protein [Actinokineospora xionganensis]MBC6447792.1 hypothetical protein [Actinokineospora xionganensis]